MNNAYCKEEGERRGRPLCSMRTRLRTTVYLFLIAAVTFAAFSPVLKAGFINWDDDENVVHCEGIRVLDRSTASWLFTNFAVGDFKPLTWLSYMLDYRIWGLNPFGYHLGNLVLHACNSCLVFLLLIRMAGTARDCPARSILPAALFAALFFALHPLRVGSVAWVSERKGLLCAFFYLSAVLAYMRYGERGGAALYACALLLSCLALLSKPAAATLPFILLLLDAFPLERTGIGWRRLLAEKVPFFIAAGAAAAMAWIGQARHGALAPLQSFGLMERVLLAMDNCALYLYRAVLPLKPAAVYPPPGSLRVTAQYLLLVMAPLFLISMLSIILWRRKRRWFPACWLWFLITIIPLSGLFPSGMEASADRWTYIPAVGLSGMVFGLLLFLFGGRTRKIAFTAGGAALLLLAAASFEQSRLWDNSETLWADAVKKYPGSPVARAHYGQVLFERGADGEAVPHLRRALDLLEGKALLEGDISYAVRSNLAQALGRSGRPEEAAAILENILESRDSWFLHHSLAGIYRRMNRNEEASLEYERVLERRPDWVPTLCDYGLMKAQGGQPEEAIRLYQRALRLEPGSPRARYNLALAFLDTGESERAVAVLRELTEESPDSAVALRALAVALTAAGDEREAGVIQELRETRTPLSARELPYSRAEKPGVLYPLRERR